MSRRAAVTTPQAGPMNLLNSWYSVLCGERRELQRGAGLPPQRQPVAGAGELSNPHSGRQTRHWAGPALQQTRQSSETRQHGVQTLQRHLIAEEAGGVGREGAQHDRREAAEQRARTLLPHQLDKHVPDAARVRALGSCRQQQEYQGRSGTRYRLKHQRGVS